MLLNVRVSQSRAARSARSEKKEGKKKERNKERFFVSYLHCEVMTVANNMFSFKRASGLLFQGQSQSIIKVKRTWAKFEDFFPQKREILQLRSGCSHTNFICPAHKLSRSYFSWDENNVMINFGIICCSHDSKVYGQ